MFERYLAEALASHFGHFIENFNADKVKVSVWNGEVVLKDLKLKRHALDHLLRSNKNRNSNRHNRDSTCTTGARSNKDNPGEGNDDSAGSNINANADKYNDSGNNGDGTSTVENGDEDEFEFPCEISYGHIGTFELHIPWTLFRNTSTSQLVSSLPSPISPTSSDGYKGNWSSVMGRWGSSSTTKTEANNNDKAQTKSASCSITLSDVNILIHPGTNLSKKKNKAKANNVNQQNNKDGDNNNTSNHDPSEGKENILHHDRIQKERQVQKILDEALFRKNIDFSTLLSSTSSSITEGDGTGDDPYNTAAKSKQERSQFFGNLIKKIVSSLSITVRNVHIRYEDTGDCLGFDATNIIPLGDTNNSANEKQGRLRYRPPFAIGVTLKEFTVYSTENGPIKDEEMYSVPNIDRDLSSNNKKGIKEHENRDGDGEAHDSFDDNCNSFSLQHKLAAATNLSVYWDSDLAIHDMIHISALKRQRRRRRKEKLKRKIHTDGASNSQSGNHLNVPSQAVTSNITNLESVEDDDELNDNIDDNKETLSNLYAIMLNEVMESPDSGNQKYSPMHRTYIIEPISPSVHFTIVSLLPQRQHEVNFLPPSRAVLHLPPFQSNFSKDTMEDIAYLRRSFALWNEMKNSILSRKVCNQLISLRPKISPLQDPRGWWRYSFEAVKTLTKLKKNDDRPSHVQRRKGWLGLSRLLYLRRKYVSLYEKLLVSNFDDVTAKQEWSDELSRIEDSVEVDEIVAFRMSLVCKQISAREQKESDTNLNQYSNGSASLSIPKSEHENTTKKETPCRFFAENEILSWKQRESMYYEMIEALGIDGLQSYDAFISETNESISSTEGIKNTVTSGSKLEVSIICPQVTLQADDVVSETNRKSSYVNRRRSHSICNHRPILQLTFASIQKFCLRHDSSWDVLCTLASLEVLNLMNQPPNKLSSSTPRLLTRKRPWTSSPMDEVSKSVRIGVMSHFHSASVFVQKSITNEFVNDQNPSNNMSTMIVSVNVSPMEATYSPDPVHAFTQLFSNAQTSELLSDYHRLKTMLSTWQAQQKRRLMEVLSQKENKLIINIDVTAPVFFMHDELSNGTLMVDLGRMKFYNDEAVNTSVKDYDGWRLVLKDVQALSLPRPDFISSSESNLVEHTTTCHIIEPFSLDFKIQTKFDSEEWKDDTNGLSSEILVNATLPRLAFNLTSSSVRLVNRLIWKRQISKAQRSLSNKPAQRQDAFGKSHHVQRSLNYELTQQEDVVAEGHRVSKICVNPSHDKKKSLLDFCFSAPLISLRLTNDVDGRDSLSKTTLSAQMPVTPIAELVIQGIGGKISHSTVLGGRRDLSFSACLKSLYATDLYQQAGNDYSLLLSSCQPDFLNSTRKGSSFDNIDNQSNDSDIHSDDTQNDLVHIAFDRHFDEMLGTEKGDFKIKFYELYVEFNPETLAAVQKALRLTPDEKRYFNELPERPLSQKFTSPIFVPDESEGIFYHCESSDDSTAFFDTIEDLEEDDLSSSGASIVSVPLKCEHNVQHDNYSESIKPGLFLTPMVLRAVEAISTGKQNYENHLWLENEDDNETVNVENEPQPQPTLSVHFELTKLRVRLNKESRLRRLVTVEMSETSVEFKSKPFGGSSTTAKVGNLTITDPSHLQGATLYGEILGLKRNLCGTDSLLNIKFETFPRNQESIVITSQQDHIIKERDPLMPVKINAADGVAYGCDNYLSLHFSPMRFVFLQQLWLEIIDYFFEGILGCEVWGSVPPQIEDRNREKEILKELSSQEQKNGNRKDLLLLGTDATDVRFRLFHVLMDSPTIIMPVTYRSPQHLTFDIKEIMLRNKYSSQTEKCNVIGKDVLFKQWYNNCKVHFNDLTLSSWCGSELSINGNPKKVKRKAVERGSIPLDIDIKWPSGPYSQLIVPKWSINFQITTLR